MTMNTIKTWQERLPKDKVATGKERAYARDAEIADLRGLLAAKEQPSAPSELHDIFDMIREWAALPEGQRGDIARQIIGRMNDSYMAGVKDGRATAATLAAKEQREAVSASVTQYQTGTWFDATTVDEMQQFYLSRLPAIRAAAREHGYAIGVHGSERRDFDLMAMQWREDASDKDSLARAIANAACGIRREGAYDWEQKPMGRVATSIPVCWTDHSNPDFDNMISAGHIDLSIIATPPAAPVADGALGKTIQERDHYHDTADKLAEAIAKYFGADIGEHSSANCPWDEALRVIEEAAPVADGGDAVDAKRYRWILENYALGDGYRAVDNALIEGEADTTLSPAIDAAIAASEVKP